MEKSVLKSRDACEILGLRSEALRVLAQKGRLKAYRPNADGHRYYSMQGIQEFLETHILVTYKRKTLYKPLNENMSFATAHNWIKEHYGKANHCENNPTHKGDYQWANIGHTYRRIRGEWRQLCRHCHWDLDNPQGKVEVKPRSWKNSQSTIVSFRLPTKEVAILQHMAGQEAISSVCRQIVLKTLKFVLHHPQEGRYERD